VNLQVVNRLTMDMDLVIALTELEGQQWLDKARRFMLTAREAPAGIHRAGRPELPAEPNDN
jgi:hypothetical protein